LKLTPKQKCFCDEWLIDMNATQAAIRAGYSKKTANEQGARLLANVSVKDYIKKKQSKLADKIEITQERILQELAKIALSDIREFYNPDGSLKNISELSDAAAAALSGIEVDELFEGFGDERRQVGYTKKIKRWDKVAAIANISKMMGWNAPDKVINTISLSDQPIVFE
jgi:phage terminase small subunit